MTRYRWAQWGDINAFFGLMLDNVAVMVLLIGAISAGQPRADRFTPEFVVTRMIPGTALGVLLGDLVYTFLAFRLARRLGRDDVTAMPLGLDTPSTFAVAFLVLLPALDEANGRFPGDHDTAMVHAWHVGAVMLVLIGVVKTVFAPVGNAVRRWVPRAGLLGSLAAIALALIAFLPLLMDIAAVPLVGFLTLTVILVTLVAHRSLPGKVPGALAAVGAGLFAYLGFQALGNATGWALVPPPEHTVLTGANVLAPLPVEIWQWTWWQSVTLAALARMPVMVPFALATIIGGIDCTESAAAAGDEYDTRSILLTEGLASVAAGLCGGVIQNTPYIGQPAYKAMGGRAAYTLATALFIGAAGFFGWGEHLFEWLPRAALFPILVYVGLEITAQSFRATPPAHYPALALAALPALAYLATVPLNAALGRQPPDPGGAAVVQTLRCLANGFIVTSLLWAAALAALIDRKLLRSAGYLLVAAVCAFFGVIHSPFRDALIDLPWRVMDKLPPEARYQTPLHWTATYVLAAGLLVILSLFGAAPIATPEKKASEPHAPGSTDIRLP
jgi:AGZA family xanthine/uracil permease-like MFS transporter